jgi:hypothetical protein
LYLDPLITGDETAKYWSRLMSDLRQTPPDLVAVALASVQRLPADAPVFAWLDANYQLVESPFRQSMYEFYLRRGSDLEKRLLHSP